jgi:esterase
MLSRMLAYTTRGEGTRVVLMMHGFLGSGRNLGLIARRWSARDPAIKIVLPDLTGHGASPPLPPNATLADLARDVLALADHLAIASPIELVGHSLGGRVALAALIVAPERIGSTVLLDSTPARLEGRKTDLTEVVRVVLAAPEQAATREVIAEALLAGGLSKGLVEWLMMNVVAAEGGYRWRIDRRALADLLDRSRLEELWPAIEREGARAKLVWGENSSFVRAEDRERMERAGCPTIRIDGAGHFLHVEKPDAVLQAILAQP